MVKGALTNSWLASKFSATISTLMSTTLHNSSKEAKIWVCHANNFNSSRTLVTIFNLPQPSYVL
ncbi:hypothetical protein V6Z11_D04G029000 [Gossypium hirsutum]